MCPLKSHHIPKEYLIDIKVLYWKNQRDEQMVFVLRCNYKWATVYLLDNEISDNEFVLFMKGYNIAHDTGCIHGTFTFCSAHYSYCIWQHPDKRFKKLYFWKSNE